MTVLGSTHPPRFPIGQSDYALLRRQNLTYVDKTMWVADVIDNSAVGLMVTRPRRFGKTLNMTTLRYFLERSPEDRTELFADTALWSARDGAYRQHYQRYPVIYLTFKDLKEATMEALGQRLRLLLSGVVRDLDEAYGHGHRALSDRLRIASLQDEKSPLSHFSDMLAIATKWLHLITGVPAVVLIDEYDAPLHAAWQNGYWDDAVMFFRNFLSAGLKDNPHLYKGVLTGILKVAKEGIFSGLNHLETASVLNDAMIEHFGFSDDEVTDLVTLANEQQHLPALRGWYNGYRFGIVQQVTAYNPWSVISFLKAPESGPRSFWKNTSDNGVIHILLRQHAATIGPAVQTWLEGGTVERVIDENVALVQLQRDANAVFGLLLFSGYLTVSAIRTDETGVVASLCIPNAEVRGVFRDVFRLCLEQAERDSGAVGAVDYLRASLLEGDAERVEDTLGSLLCNILSHHDVAGDRVEAVYQAFIVGLLVHLDTTHRVHSNREAGHGRADVLITPRVPGPGAVIELKRVMPRETPELALDRAAAQILDRDYAAEVRAAGATEVYQYAVVFDGKRCWVKAVEG